MECTSRALKLYDDENRDNSVVLYLEEINEGDSQRYLAKYDDIISNFSSDIKHGSRDFFRGLKKAVGSQNMIK